ncbi:hypothetical protein C8C83_0406 [Flavobacterium sp. 90]|nr:hypothetical protein C8C82_0701 [Flavobacterium sp. 81]TCK52602.1 hypothetical protein C8C83_0406 [Flavobacterium sp. 90]
MFVQDLKANAIEFDNDYKRIIEENGQSNETKLEFYNATFHSIINTLKSETPVDSDKIQYSYRRYMNALKEDNISTTDLLIEKSKFTISEINTTYPWLKESKSNENNYTPTHIAYNPNTKYGRRKAREQAQRNYENGTDEYRNEIDNIKFVIWLIIILIAVFIFFIKASLSK